MNIFRRFWNLILGALGVKVAQLEAANPAIVFENEIAARLEKHAELKRGVSALGRERDKVKAQLEQKQKDLAEIPSLLQAAIDSSDEAVGEHLCTLQEQLEEEIAAFTTEHDSLSTQVEEAKKGLITYEGEIKKLRRDKERLLATKSSSEARIQLQEALSGLSTNAGTQALTNVTESIEKLKSQADMGAEMANESLDGRLAKLRESAALAKGKSKFEELKRQQQAAQAATAQQKTL